MGLKIATKGDVYSYGILLLEMFTGKRPVDDMFKDGVSLHKYVEMALPGNVREVADLVPGGARSSRGNREERRRQSSRRSPAESESKGKSKGMLAFSDGTGSVMLSRITEKSDGHERGQQRTECNKE